MRQIYQLVRSKRLPCIPWLLAEMESRSNEWASESGSESYLVTFEMKGLRADNLAVIYDAITYVVDSHRVKALQLIPKRWPTHAVIECRDEDAKKALLDQGLIINDIHIEVSEGGIGRIKVTIEDAPLEMPNYMISDSLKGYGDVTDTIRQKLYINGRKTDWYSGNRAVYMKNVNVSLPPTIMIEFKCQQFKVNVRHEGQTLYECRFCKLHVSKMCVHNCSKKPVITCYNCLEEGHISKNCKNIKKCRKCRKEGHTFKDCPETHPAAAAAQEVEGAAAQRMDQELSPRTVIEDAHRRLFPKTNVSVVALGTSNMRDLPLKGDDDLEITQKILCEGGLLVSNASDKLDDLSPEELHDKQAVVLHVGACDFPKHGFPEETANQEVDSIYMQIADEIEEITDKCPNARLYISSIPPRKGELNRAINQQINRLNIKLKQYALNDEEICTYVNNDAYLTDGERTITNLYEDNDDIHLSDEGRGKLATFIFEAIKNDHFRDKENWSYGAPAI